MVTHSKKKRKRDVHCIEWIGKPILRTKKILYYSGYMLNDVSYHVGDCITVNVDGNREIQATIICLWQQEDQHYKAEVRYFVDAKTLKQIPMKSSIYETDQCDEIELDWIVGHTTVPSASYFYSVYTNVLKPIEPELSCHERSLLIYSRRAQLHPELRPNYTKPTNKKTSATLIQRLKRVSEKLRTSHIPKILPCREKERDYIYSFLKNGIQAGGSDPLYICGVQGIGKTATVMEVLGLLSEERDNEEIQDFEYILVNGMTVPRPEILYNQVWKAIKKHEVKIRPLSAKNAALQLSELFSSTAHRRPTIVLIIDEIDCVLTKKNKELYNFLNWPRVPNAKLIIIGIANAPDLHQRIESKLGSRLGGNHLLFEPYTKTQIETIINERIGGEKLVDSIALTLHAKKIALNSGDIRLALTLCQKAAEECLARVKKNPTSNAHATISIQDINKAMKDSLLSPQVLELQNLSTVECLLIASMANELVFRDCDQVAFQIVLTRMKNQNNTGDLGLELTTSIVLKVCDALDACRFIRCYRHEKLRYPLLRLEVGVSEIVTAWNSHWFGRKLLSDGVRQKYERKTS